jgi:ferric-dicitrate binding protein FerR (iron transport regulator)
MRWPTWANRANQKRFSARHRPLALAAFAALAAATPAGAITPGATVTAVSGNAGASGVALERQARLADGDSLQTGADGACSVLVDGDTVLELCQSTSLRLGHRDGRADGPRVLELRSGEIRVLAAQRPADQRIEIHTPAAIATILGSVVYVAVDAKGVTTIASAESNVRVESSRRLGRVLTLTAGQQVTVRPGAPIPRVAQIWDPEDSPADGCLIDFRAIAFDDSRDPGDGRALDAITRQDVIDALPAVGAAREEGSWESPLRDSWIDPKLHGIYDVIDTGAAAPPSDPGR